MVTATEGAADQAPVRERARLRMISVRSAVSSDVIPMTNRQTSDAKTAQSSKPEPPLFDARLESSATISPQEIRVENFIARFGPKVENLLELNSPLFQA